MLKMAVTALGPDPGDKISDLFAECTHLQIYDGDTQMLIEVIARDGRSDAQLAQILADMWVEAVICGPLQQDAFDIIAGDEYSITRYNGVGMTALIALKAALDYKLDVIRDPIGGVGCLGSHLHLEREH
jgi:predicted Fe-Mo cluster-binding NifX family protein